MKTDQELMQQALDDLMSCSGAPHWPVFQPTITALRERLAKPEMQPCAGRNCGSTNPNLHSAECFEDYEKATGMAQPEQKQDSTCNKTLRAEGKGYPRTCRKCGFGPCIADRVQPAQEPLGYWNAVQGWIELPGEAQAPAAWVYPEALEAFRQGKPWTAYGENGSGPNFDGVERIPLYATPPAAQPTQRQPHEWITVDDCMPEPGAYVLAVFRYTTGKQRVIRAMHAPRHTLSEDDYGEFVTEGADYDEATDTTYWPEGWYECNENEETHWQVHEEVTHWMPLPAAPSVGEKPDAA